MAKKSFKESNPALQFISAAAETLREEPAPASQPVSAVSPAQPVAMESGPAPASSPKKVRTSETKSKRLNLLIQPSVLDDLAKIACMKQTSVNDLINCVLRAYRDEQADLIRRYMDVFGAQ